MYLIKKIRFLIIVLIFSVLIGCAQDYPDEYFLDGAIRVGFVLEGDYLNTSIAIQSISKQDTWGGNVINLIDPFEFGEYKFNIIHEKTGNKRRCNRNGADS